MCSGAKPSIPPTNFIDRLILIFIKCNVTPFLLQKLIEFVLVDFSLNESLHTYVHVYECIPAHTYVYGHMCISLCVESLHIRTFVHSCICPPMYICVYICTYVWSMLVYTDRRTCTVYVHVGTQVTHPKDNSSGRKDSPSSSSTPLWSPQSSCPPTPLQSLSRSSSQVSISATSMMSESGHLHPHSNGQGDLETLDNEPPSQLPISSEAIHLPPSVSREQNEVSPPQSSRDLFSNTGVGSVDNSTHIDTLVVRRATQSHQGTQSSTQSTQTVGNKGDTEMHDVTMLDTNVV